MQHLTSKYKTMIQFFKFGIIGVTNTIIACLLNIGFLWLLHPYHIAWDYIAGNMMGFILSVLWAFYWNNKFVFREEPGQSRSWLKTLLKTYLAYAFTGIILNNILSYIWITVFAVSKYVTPLFNLIISVPINFIINKFWAFKK